MMTKCSNRIAFAATALLIIGSTTTALAQQLKGNVVDKKIYHFKNESDPDTHTGERDETSQEPDETESDTIPPIKDNPTLPDVQGTPVIDVEEMTRNPNAEVVDSKIEYGTKEADTNEE